MTSKSSWYDNINQLFSEHLEAWTLYARVRPAWTCLDWVALVEEPAITALIPIWYADQSQAADQGLRGQRNRLVIPPRELTFHELRYNTQRYIPYEVGETEIAESVTVAITMNHELTRKDRIKAEERIRTLLDSKGPQNIHIEFERG